MIMRSHLVFLAVTLLLLTACGRSYEDTKRERREAERQSYQQDSAALKIAVMPTLDCLPLFVARHYNLLDTLHGGVRLKTFTAQMDCDTALTRGRVEGAFSDLVRAKKMERDGLKLRYVALTGAYWQLIANRNARIHQLRQLDDKMVAMTRYSVTDMLTDKAVDSSHLQKERVFCVQINDVNVRMQMLRNNEMDAMWLTEPQATAARNMKHTVIADSRQMGLQGGVLVFNEKEMRLQTRATQLQLLTKAYNQACDSINKHGIRHYGQLIMNFCNIDKATVDSLPSRIAYSHASGPLQKDVAAVERWLEGK